MGTNQDKGIQNCSYDNLTVTILLVAALSQSHISFKLNFCKKDHLPLKWLFKDYMTIFKCLLTHNNCNPIMDLSGLYLKAVCLVAK